MTPELIAIIAATVALAGLMLRQTNALRREMNEKFAKVDERFDKLIERFDRLIERFDKLIERKLEGSLEGEQEAATCNRVA